MFPSVIPLYGTDCSRVTHPSAARMFSVQALRTSPLDLHVLSTPPAFVLSQDQTLMFNPSPAPSLPLPPRQRLPPRALAGIALAFLTSSLAQLPASRRSRSSWLSTELFPLLCIVFKVRSLSMSFNARVIISNWQ